MLFDKLKKRKKYPHNRKAPVPAEAVYAGPEQMGRFRPEEDAPRKVYAGPERPRKDPFDTVCGGPPLVPEEPPADVYAGPEVFEREAEAPEEPARLVYAGPEYFARDREEPEKPEPAKPVYAGPEDLEENLL